MTRSTKIEARKKIVAHIKRRGHVSDFIVTPVLVMRWWNLLNKAIFDSTLTPPHKIIVRNFRDSYGWCMPMAVKGKVQLGINVEFEDRKTFLTILVHEMIHQYQWTHIGEMTHGKTFWMWKKQIKQVLNLPLFESY